MDNESIIMCTHTHPATCDRVVLVSLSKIWVVDTLNLSQEMSEKMQNKSGQFNYTIMRKPQKGENVFFF